MKRPGKSRIREREIAEELDAHVRMAMEERIDRGEEPEVARLAAEREIGDRRDLEAAIRTVWDETTSRRVFSGLFRSGRVSLFIAVACGLIGSAALGNQRLYSSVLSLLRKAPVGLESDQVSIVVLAIACLTVLVLVTLCANLANFAQDRHRDEILRRCMWRIRTSQVWSSAVKGSGE